MKMTKQQMLIGGGVVAAAIIYFAFIRKPKPKVTVTSFSGGEDFFNASGSQKRKSRLKKPRIGIKKSSSKKGLKRRKKVVVSRAVLVSGAYNPKRKNPNGTFGATVLLDRKGQGRYFIAGKIPKGIKFFHTPAKAVKGYKPTKMKAPVGSLLTKRFSTKIKNPKTGKRVSKGFTEVVRIGTGQRILLVSGYIPSNVLVYPRHSMRKVVKNGKVKYTRKTKKGGLGKRVVRKRMAVRDKANPMVMPSPVKAQIPISATTKSAPKVQIPIKQKKTPTGKFIQLAKGVKL